MIDLNGHAFSKQHITVEIQSLEVSAIRLNPKHKICIRFQQKNNECEVMKEWKYQIEEALYEICEFESE